MAASTGGSPVLPWADQSPPQAADAEACAGTGGPLSLALYLTDAEAQQFLRFVETSVLSARQGVAYHVVYRKAPHPINQLHSVALAQALLPMSSSATSTSCPPTPLQLPQVGRAEGEPCCRWVWTGLRAPMGPGRAALLLPEPSPRFRVRWPQKLGPTSNKRTPDPS